MISSLAQLKRYAKELKEYSDDISIVYLEWAIQKECTLKTPYVYSKKCIERSSSLVKSITDSYFANKLYTSDINEVKSFCKNKTQVLLIVYLCSENLSSYVNFLHNLKVEKKSNLEIIIILSGWHKTSIMANIVNFVTPLAIVLCPFDRYDLKAKIVSAARRLFRQKLLEFYLETTDRNDIADNDKHIVKINYEHSVQDISAHEIEDSQFDFIDFDEDEESNEVVVSANKADEQKISAVELFAQRYIDQEVADELIEASKNLAELLYRSELNEEFLDEAIKNFEVFAKRLREGALFLKLATSVELLCIALSGLKTNLRSMDENEDFIMEFLIAIIQDLNNWTENVLINKIAKDIYYLDASLISSITMLNEAIKQD